MTIGFIGLGNMATAIISGILTKNIVRPDEIIGADKSKETLEKAADRYGIRITTDNGTVAAAADILILAVKPQFLEEVLLPIKDKVRSEVVIVSIVAGKTMEWIEAAFLGRKIKLIRCMPNTPALVGEGCSGLCRNSQITDEDMQTVLKLMSSFGLAREVPERMMDAVMAVSGSAPAYIFMVIEAMADGAVCAGMPREQAYQFAAQTVLGSAKMVLETKKHPGELKDMVCSPGGTTIEAVKVLEERGLRGAVMKGMEACINKSKHL